jgi:hypothetical protein
MVCATSRTRELYIDCSRWDGGSTCRGAIEPSNGQSGSDAWAEVGFREVISTDIPEAEPLLQKSILYAQCVPLLVSKIE